MPVTGHLARARLPVFLHSVGGPSNLDCVSIYLLAGYAMSEFRIQSLPSITKLDVSLLPIDLHQALTLFSFGIEISVGERPHS